MCIDLCKGMCIDACKCLSLTPGYYYSVMCVDMRAYMCMHMCMHVFMDTRINMCRDMCVDMPVVDMRCQLEVLRGNLCA